MFDVHFKLRYCRKNKQPDYTLPATIQFVVNIDGIYSSPRSTGISVIGSKWNGAQQRISGSTDEIQAQNRRLSNIKAGLDKLHQDLCLLSEFITPQYLVDVYVGKREKRITVLKAYHNMIEELKNPVEPNAAILKEKTLEKWDKSYEYIKEFLDKQKLNKIEVIQFSHPLAERYRKFLYEKGFGQDHVSRNLSYLKKAFKIAKKLGDAHINPISDVECPRSKPKKALPLTFEQIQRLVDFRSQDIFMQQAADILVFMCFTGLDHCDYIEFNTDKNLIEVNGEKLLSIRRLKMHRGGVVPEPTLIPILPQAQAILDKYRGCLPLMKYHTLLDNLKYILRNIGVKEAMSLKNMRETFGTYLLNKGLRLEVIRDVMGHETVKQTEETYTIVYPETLIKEFVQKGLI